MTSLEMATSWANDPAIDPQDRQELQKLIEANDQKEIEERFYKDLEFGTGGLRGIMGVGRNRYNKYNVRRATQAVCQVLKKQGGNSLKVAVAYDSRLGSVEFAQEVCGVLAAHEITALLYDFMTPVGLLSFSVLHHQAHAGVMITASHNPKIYNGYKLYWDDGAQVTPPNDQLVIEEYQNLNNYSELRCLPFEQAKKQGWIQSVGQDVVDQYFKAIDDQFLRKDKTPQSRLNIVYTPLHGTGLPFVTRMLKDVGNVDVSIVEKQAQADGNFPSAPTPNPELPETMEMAVDQMIRENADLCMGTDPDTDRLGVVVNDHGKPYFLNGNQLGNLLLHYILEQRAQQNLIPKHPLVIKTIVTTELQQTLCDAFEVKLENTLTGFKWMGARLKELESTPTEFIFGNEESFGYLTHRHVRDKDAVAAIGLFAEMALFYKDLGHNLIEALDQIYEKFGFSHELLVSLHYLGKEGNEKMARIMDRFRNLDLPEICGEQVVQIDDYLTQKIIKKESNETLPLEFPRSNVLGFTFQSGNKLLMRPSGTEPKIKFYILVQEKEGNLEEKKRKAQAHCQEFEKFVHDFCEQS